MAINKLLTLLNGLVQTVTISGEELQVLSITVGGVSGTNLDKTGLDSLISNKHASGSDNQNVTAGDGLTGGGSGASPTLAVGAGDGIEVSADAVAVKLDGTTLSKSGSGLKVNSIADAQIASNAAIALSKLAALTASKVLVSDSSGVISASSVSSTTLGYLDATSSIQTQLDAKLAKSGGTMSGAIDMSSNKITSLGTPTAANDATTKSYVDTLVVTGGRIKEAILTQNQLSSTYGILAAMMIDVESNPVADDTIVINNGTLAETWTFKASRTGAFEVTIGGSHTATMQNLATAIATDSANEGGVFDAALIVVDGDGVVIVYDKTTGSGASASRIYGTWATQADCKVIPFNGLVEYSTSGSTEMTLPASDPGAGRFGFRRQVSALVDGEIHVALDSNVQYSWNASLVSWVTSSGSASIPDATSGSGGAVKGKVTFDSDKGLSVSSGVASIQVDDATISFGSLGNAGKLVVKSGGITVTQLALNAVETDKIKNSNVTLGKIADSSSSGQFILTDNSNHPTYQTMSGDVTVNSSGVAAIGSGKVTDSMLAGSISDSKLSTITTGNKVSGSAVQLKADSGLANDTGLKVVLQANEGIKVSSSGLAIDYDNSSIGIVSNKLAVKSSGITSDMLAGSIADSKLSTISTSNKVSGSAVQLKSTGALEDSTGLAVKVDGTTITVNGSNQLAVATITKVYTVFTNNTGGSLSAGDVVALSKTVNGEVIAADASAIASCECVAGIVAETIGDGSSGKVQIAGEATVNNGGSNFDLGKRVYVSTSAKVATKTAPTAASSVVYLLGGATAVNKVLLQPSLVAVN